MSKRKCPACARPFLKGRRVQLVGSLGGLAPRLVCASCADGGVTIVVQRTGTPRCTSCGTRAACFCGECALSLRKLAKVSK